MNEPALEFVWVGDDAIDPLEQAQTLQILVSAGIKTREEARADLGLGGAPPAMARAAGAAAPERTDTLARLGKFNPYHDEQGRFTTADDAVATVGSPARKPRPTEVQVANNDAVMSDTPELSPIAYAAPEEGEQKRSGEDASGATIANITCDQLLESDYAICSSAAFEEDHHYRGQCFSNMLLRNRECIAGFPLSPLLPY
jgi:hypothetical protein